MRRVGCTYNKSTSHCSYVTVFSSLFCLILLLGVSSLALGIGFSSDTSMNPSTGSSDAATDISDESSDVSAQQNQMDTGPEYEPVAIILVDSEVVCAQEPVLFDATESCIQLVHDSGYYVETIPTDDDLIEPLNNNTTNQTNQSTSTSSQDQQSCSPHFESFHWDFGDETTADTSQKIHQYTHTGIYPVTLRVQDSNGNMDTANTTITVVPSKIDKLTVTNPGTGGTLQLSWNPVPDHEVVYYQIHRQDRNKPFTTTSTDYTDSNLKNGQTYHYQIAAVDYVGNKLFIGPLSDPMSGTPLLFNSPPLAETGGPYFGWTHTPIIFDGSQSIDYDGDITDYLWDFGDDTTAKGSIVTHSFTLPGTYPVTLTVTDTADETQTDTAIVTIAEHKKQPAANASGPYHGYTDHPIQLNGTLSRPATGKTLRYTWDLGDGTKATGATPTHTYKKEGTYQIILTVLDEADQKNIATTYAFIKDKNKAPSRPLLTVQKKQQAGTYEITVQSTDPEDDPLHYLIDWGDHTHMKSPCFPSGTILRASHQWDTQEVYTITVHAIDINNNTSNKTTHDIHIKTASTEGSFSVETTITSFVSSMSNILGLDHSSMPMFTPSFLAFLLIVIELSVLVFLFRKLKKY